MTLAAFRRTILQRNKLSLQQQLKKIQDPGATSASTKVSADTDSEGEAQPDSDDSGNQSDPEEESERELRLQAQVEKLKKSHGISHDATLKKIFKLVNVNIAQYKLNQAFSCQHRAPSLSVLLIPMQVDAILDEVMTTCKERGGDWYVKAIQARGFCRWKQYKLDEALALFKEQARIFCDHDTPGIILDSHIIFRRVSSDQARRSVKILDTRIAAWGNSMRSYYFLCHKLLYRVLITLQAVKYFESGLALLKQGSHGNKAGLYYGLGLIKERQNKGDEAIPILKQGI